MAFYHLVQQLVSLPLIAFHLVMVGWLLLPIGVMWLQQVQDPELSGIGRRLIRHYLPKQQVTSELLLLIKCSLNQHHCLLLPGTMWDISAATLIWYVSISTAVSCYVK